MTRYLPICLDLQGRRAVVIGGGAVGTHRAADLVECGARVTVVSPEASVELRAEAERGRIELKLRRYEAGDTEGAFVVVVATDDPETNAAVYAEAAAAGRLVNVCDDPEHCTFIFAS